MGLMLKIQYFSNKDLFKNSQNLQISWHTPSPIIAETTNSSQVKSETDSEKMDDGVSDVVEKSVKSDDPESDEEVERSWRR